MSYFQCQVCNGMTGMIGMIWHPCACETNPEIVLAREAVKTQQHTGIALSPEAVKALSMESQFPDGQIFESVEERFGYMCGTSFRHHLATEAYVNDPEGAQIYGDLETLKEKRRCVLPEDGEDYCSILRVKITVEEVIQTGL